MAVSRQVLDNPVSGERITFRKTAADTDGELLAIDLELSPDGHVPGAHVHPAQEERFEVVKGTMTFRKGLRIITASAGDTVVVPAGTVHRFENGGNTPAHVRVEVRPALRMEELFETAVALARDGRTTAGGMPHPLGPRAVHARVRSRGPSSVHARGRHAYGCSAAGVAGAAPGSRFPLCEAHTARAPVEA
jgi:mannose-6-phosphate isomerase-like protein (cupin superfamily)